jgi:hypothetical protein
MNITKGQSVAKEHLQNGSMTACNRRTSGVGKNEFESFKFFANKYPESCCKVCLTKYNERLERLNKKAKI